MTHSHHFQIAKAGLFSESFSLWLKLLKYIGAKSLSFGKGKLILSSRNFSIKMKGNVLKTVFWVRFLHFLGEVTAQQFCFEINWPLDCTRNSFLTTFFLRFVPKFEKSYLRKSIPCSCLYLGGSLFLKMPPSQLPWSYNWATFVRLNNR